MKEVRLFDGSSVASPAEPVKRSIDRLSSNLSVDIEEIQVRLMIPSVSVSFTGYSRERIGWETNGNMLRILAEKGISAEAVNEACRD